MPLSGADLINMLANLDPSTSEAERIKLAGYTFMRQGKERLNRAGYYKALTAANPATSALSGRRGSDTTKRSRTLSFQTAVLAQGHAVLGRAYVESLGAKHGDRLQFTPGVGQITVELLRN